MIDIIETVYRGAKKGLMCAARAFAGRASRVVLPGVRCFLWCSTSVYLQVWFVASTFVYRQGVFASTSVYRHVCTCASASVCLTLTSLAYSRTRFGGVAQGVLNQVQVLTCCSGQPFCSAKESILSSVSAGEMQRKSQFMIRSQPTHTIFFFLLLHIFTISAFWLRNTGLSSFGTCIALIYLAVCNQSSSPRSYIWAIEIPTMTANLVVHPLNGGITLYSIFNIQHFL